MQDSESELRRIPLPRTPVNRGKQQGRAALERVSWRARLNEKMSVESQRCVCAGRDRCSDWLGNETPARSCVLRFVLDLRWVAPRLCPKTISEGAV
jgi:hypothetical protein